MASNFRFTLDDKQLRAGVERSIRNFMRVEEAAEEASEAVERYERATSGRGSGGGGSGRGGGRGGVFGVGRRGSRSISTDPIEDAVEFRKARIRETNRALEDALTFRRNLVRRETQERNRAARDAFTFRKNVIRQENKALEDAVRKTVQDARKALNEQNKAYSDSLKFRRTTIREEQRSIRQLQSQINSARRQIEVGLLELFFTLHSLAKPIDIITNAIAEFTLGNIRASAELEKFSSVLKTATAESELAQNTLKRLLDITVDLAAIDTASLVQFSARLQNANLTSREAERVIVAVTKRMEEQGKSASTTNRVLEQVTQAVNANIISMQDFRPILREYPSLYRDFSAALGESINDLDSLRAAADRAGGATEAIVRAFDYVASIAQGADVNTIAKQIDELNDRVFVLRSALGDALRPIVLAFLQTANDFLDWLSGMDESMRRVIGVISLLAIAFGKVLYGSIQIAIAAIAGLHFESAIYQIRNATTVIQRMAAEQTGANIEIEKMPRHVRNAEKYVGAFTKGLRFLSIGFASVTVAAGIATFLISEFTKNTRLANKEYDTFIGTLLKIPTALTQGDSAIQRQIEQLREYRFELQTQRDEFRRGFAISGRRGLDINEQRTRRAQQLIRGLVEPANSAERAFLQLDKQVTDNNANINDLTIVLEDNENALEAVARIADRYEEAISKAIEAGDDDKVRRLHSQYTILVNVIKNLINPLEDASEELDGIAEELIVIDFQIRRLERTFKAFELGEIFRDFDTDAVRQNVDEQIRLLELEAAKKKQLINEEEDDEKKKNREIKKIDEQLAFDKENVRRAGNEKIKELELEIIQAARAAGRLVAQANADAEAQRDANNRYWRIRHRELEYQRFVDSRNAQRLIIEANEDAEQARYANELYWSKRHRELEYNRFSESRAAARLIVQSNEDAEQQRYANELYWSKRHRELEFERARRSAEAQRLILEHSQAATEGRDNAEENRRRLAEIDEFADRISRTAQTTIRENNRLIKSFTRGLSRSFVDLLFEGESTFGEFITEFAKTSARIIIQARLESEIRKRISDDLTRHQIINIQKVAAAQLSAGVDPARLTSAEIAGLSPIAGFATSGVGTAALLGLSIVPLLVRAIQDGFSDTKVEVDKREIGKVVTSSQKRLGRSHQTRR